MLVPKILESAVDLTNWALIPLKKLDWALQPHISFSKVQEPGMGGRWGEDGLLGRRFTSKSG